MLMAVVPATVTPVRRSRASYVNVSVEESIPLRDVRFPVAPLFTNVRLLSAVLPFFMLMPAMPVLFLVTVDVRLPPSRDTVDVPL